MSEPASPEHVVAFVAVAPDMADTVGGCQSDRTRDLVRDPLAALFLLLAHRYLAAPDWHVPAGASRSGCRAAARPLLRRAASVPVEEPGHGEDGGPSDRFWTAWFAAEHAARGGIAGRGIPFGAADPVIRSARNLCRVLASGSPETDAESLAAEAEYYRLAGRLDSFASHGGGPSPAAAALTHLADPAAPVLPPPTRDRCALAVAILAQEPTIPLTALAARIGLKRRASLHQSREFGPVRAALERLKADGSRGGDKVGRVPARGYRTAGGGVEAIDRGG